ncbi:aspartyl protease family protein [Azospirillum sp. B4]|uniref:aspartyl protease family protein n=1 Tax=Azospirillum sp. B4 TaxID=95605 RepID=UPI00034BE7EF|nr:aspartyl protease family protein [Azospirillum sp. B4]
MLGQGMRVDVHARKRVAGALLALALAGAPAGAAWAGAADCHLNKIAELPIKVEHNQPLADVSLNGKPIRALVDTGAYRTTLTRGAAERLGVDVTLHAAAGGAVGVGGEVAIGSAPVADLRVGNWNARDLKLEVLDTADVGPGIELILGQDIFSQSDVEVDFAGGAIRFFQPQGCDDVPLAYWAETYAEARMKPVAGRRTSNMVRVALNDHEFWALLDTGAGGSSVQLRAAHRAGVHEDDPGVVTGWPSHGIGKRSIPTWIGSFGTFVVGDETVRNVRLRFGDYSAGLDPEREGAHDMVLGADFIKTHRIYIANSQNKIFFTNVGHPIFTPLPKTPETAPDGEAPAPGSKPPAAD